MQIVSYHKNGTIRGGLLDGERYFDLEVSLSKAGLADPKPGVLEFLHRDDWKHDLATLRESREKLEPIKIDPRQLASPIPNPRQLLIAGANTRSHLAEAAPLIGEIEPSRKPMILAKAVSCICGAHDDIIHPPETTKLDYEVEVGLVIGKKGRRIAKNAVKDHVAGYVVVNELSARDVQLAEGETDKFYRTHFIGKSFDTFCPIGPAMTTVDQIPWGAPLKMKTLVNGEVRQDSDTSDLIHSFEDLISYISSAITLCPGDIIATGSPEGVAFFMKPPGFLKAGDVVRCEVEGIGTIENTVRCES